MTAFSFYYLPGNNYLQVIFLQHPQRFFLDLRIINNLMDLVKICNVFNCEEASSVFFGLASK